MAKAKKETTPVKPTNKSAKKEDAGVPAVSEAVTAAMLEADQGVGNSGVTTQDLAVPFLYVLQANSPQCMETRVRLRMVAPLLSRLD